MRVQVKNRGPYFLRFGEKENPNKWVCEGEEEGICSGEKEGEIFFLSFFLLLLLLLNIRMEFLREENSVLEVGTVGEKLESNVVYFSNYFT